MMSWWNGRLKFGLLFGVLFLPMMLSGCGDEADIYPPNWIYKVTIVNLTYDQPFSPVIAIVRTDGYKAWEINSPASEEIERFAEGAEAEQRHSTDQGKWLLTEADNDPNVVLTGVSFVNGVRLGPTGRSKVEMSLSMPPEGEYFLTLIAGLIYTNDGFTGITNLSLADLAVDEQKFEYLSAYDAGTEANTETEETVRGFQDFEVDEDGELVLDEDGDPVPITGFGYDPVRDDEVDLVTIHPGVISKDETDPAKQIAASALDQSHRFKQPVAKIIIERTR